MGLRFPLKQPRLSEDDLNAIALHEVLHEDIKTMDFSGRLAGTNERCFFLQSCFEEGDL